MPDFEGIVNVASDGDIRIRLDGRVAQVRIGSLERRGVLFLQDTGDGGGITLHAENGITLGGGESGHTLITLNPLAGGVVIGGDNRPGQLELRAVRGGPGAVTTIELDGESADLVLGARGQSGRFVLNDANGNTTIQLTGGNGNVAVGGDGVNGDVVVRRSDGSTAIHLDGHAGDIRLENADCAEDFEICGEDDVTPGTVMVIGADGRLHPSTTAYDSAVAGIVSGAGATRPGIILGRQRTGNRCVPIALTGRVYCKVDASHAPVGVGDLLTTSDLPGHAMTARDRVQALGAVIGKALASLDNGRGLLPVLVALQ